MNKSKVIAGIDIGTSKISVIVCRLKSTDNIEVLGMGTSILKGVQKGIIVDKSLFTNALQNCIKRAQAASEIIITDAFINIPNGNSKFVIQTGIVQNELAKPDQKSDCEQAMKKAVQCITKTDQSVMHMFPITQRMDGRSDETSSAYFNMEVDTGIILGDTHNLSVVYSTLRKMGLTIKGLISDYLAMSTFSSSDSDKTPHLLIDFGAQTTSVCVLIGTQIVFAQTILIGSEHITHDLSVCLKCSYSEAERIKILHGQLDKLETDLSASVTIQTHNGPQVIKLSLVTSIIESRMNQLLQLIQKYLIHSPNFEKVNILGSGSNLPGLDKWLQAKFSKPVLMQKNIKFNDISINSNYLIALGQIIYGFQIGLLKQPQHSLIRKISEKIFKN